MKFGRNVIGVSGKITRFDIYLLYQTVKSSRGRLLKRLNQNRELFGKSLFDALVGLKHQMGLLRQDLHKVPKQQNYLRY